LKFLIAIVGPTAVGKTSLAVEIAEHFDTEIISADSRQIFKELKIGVAKPSKDELSRVKHHFIGDISIQEKYDVGRYEEEALKALVEIYKKKDIAVIVGGSGLYIKAACEGLDSVPHVPGEVRQKIMHKLNLEGLNHLLNELAHKDPDYYQEVDRSNPRRIIRALEVIETSGNPFSWYRKGSVHERPFRTIKIGLDMERKALYEKIDLRMESMISSGLFEEAEKLMPHRELQALQTVGYREVFGYYKGDYDKEEAVRLLKRNSRRYAKRQMTWFKKDRDIHWFASGQTEKIIDYTEATIADLRGMQKF